MSNIIPIMISKESVSDDSYLVLENCVENGSYVKKGDSIAILETSKTVFEITSPSDGYIYYIYNENEEVPEGEIFGAVSKKQEFPANILKKSIRIERVSKNELSQKKEKPNSGKVVRFSKVATQLIEKHNLDKKIFSFKNIVKKVDVENYLGTLKKEKSSKKDEKIQMSRSGREKILILGGKGHAKMCIDILKQIKTYEILGIVASTSAPGTKVLDIHVIGTDEEENLKDIHKSGINFAINGVGGIGSTGHKSREEIYNRLKKVGFYLPNIIHPEASIESSVHLGEGNQIMANATVGSDVVICNNCIINSGSVMSHDSFIDDNVHIAPGAILGGSVRIGKNTLIGMGVTIYLGVKIGYNVTINNGVNVIKDVPNNTVIKQ